ncbi:hypothetical protein FHG87_011528 [Trinorchestia longiramus]|nr:hypothetical protein FHG87_011528 [Trinorchestia longiramus]
MRVPLSCGRSVSGFVVPTTRLEFARPSVCLDLLRSLTRLTTAFVASSIRLADPDNITYKILQKQANNNS